MTYRILVPLDGTAETETAFPQAERIAGAGAEVHLLHIVPSLPLTVIPSSPGVMEAHDQALSYLAVLRRRLGAVRGFDLLRTGGPADATLEAALEFNIDLIVISTHARTRREAGFPASAVETVVRDAPLPVLLIGPAMPAYRRAPRRILVPVDGSEESLAILAPVERLAILTGAEVVLLQVAGRALLPVAQRSARATDGTPEDQEQRCLTAADRLEKSSLVYWQTIAQGNTVDEILRHSESLDADVIAMSTNVRSGPERTSYGSVTDAVLARANRPMLLQKPRVQMIVPGAWRFQ